VILDFSAFRENFVCVRIANMVTLRTFEVIFEKI